MSTVRNSVAVRNAYGDAFEATVGLSAHLEIRTGACAASITDPAAGELLVKYDLAADWSAPAANGVKAMSNVPLLGEAVASGTPGHYRITNAAGDVCHEDGSITATGGGGDMTIDNVVIAILQQVNLAVYAKTF